MYCALKPHCMCMRDNVFMYVCVRLCLCKCISECVRVLEVSKYRSLSIIMQPKILF